MLRISSPDVLQDLCYSGVWWVEEDVRLLLSYILDHLVGWRSLYYESQARMLVLLSSDLNCLVISNK